MEWRVLDKVAQSPAANSNKNQSSDRPVPLSDFEKRSQIWNRKVLLSENLMMKTSA